MDKSQKIIKAFTDKFDGMSREEQDAYLLQMGLRYRARGVEYSISAIRKSPIRKSRSARVYAPACRVHTSRTTERGSAALIRAHSRANSRFNRRVGEVRTEKKG